MNGSLSDVYEFRIYMLTVFNRTAGRGGPYYSDAPCGSSLFLSLFPYHNNDMKVPLSELTDRMNRFRARMDKKQPGWELAAIS